MASPWEYITGADWGNDANWSGVEPTGNESVSIGDGSNQLVINAGLDNGGVDLDAFLLPTWFVGAADLLAEVEEPMTLFCNPA